MSEADVNVRFSEAEARALIDYLEGYIRVTGARKSAYRRAKEKLIEAHRNRDLTRRNLLAMDRNDA